MKIVLYQFPATYGMDVSVSPYCAKLELYLRLTDRDYSTEKGNVFKSPNKAVPYVQWEDGTIQAESDEIIARFEKMGPSLDEGIIESERQLGEQLQTMAESKIYFSCLHHRFADSETWVHQRETVRALVPTLLSPILTHVIRRGQITKCQENGFNSEADYAKGINAVQELSEKLGDSDYFLGSEARTYDCAIWGNLANCAATVTSNPVRDAIRSDERLVKYIKRLSERARLHIPV
ncbi:glutathione S-transferase family protein [Chloroflexi bacterium TSY]|nr:glutathione S-transferase family protein [Chloroflexi bacterium TSY]